MSGNRAAYDLLRRRPGGNLSKSAPDDEKSRRNFRAVKDGIEIPLPNWPIQKAAATRTAGPEARDGIRIRGRLLH